MSVCLKNSQNTTSLWFRLRRVRSHTVQRSLLEKMARDHKVYSTRWKRMIGKGGRVVDRDSKRPELVATRQAGIMGLLCGDHDREIFAALETKRFEASYEQLAQLVLRGALQERHDGEFARNAESANPDVPKVKDTESMQKRLRAETAAYSPRRRGKWEMDGLVIELEGPPKVMGTGAFLVEKGEHAIDCVGWGTGAEDGRWWMCPDYSPCDFPRLILSIVSRPRSLVPPQSLPIRLNRPTR